MVPVALVSLLLLAITAGQYLAAPRSARKIVRQRFTVPPEYEIAVLLRAALVRRIRAQAAGTAIAGTPAVLVQWAVVDDPFGGDGLVPRVAIVLAALLTGGLLGEIIVAVRDAPSPGGGVRVTGPTPWVAHVSPRAAGAEAGLAVLVLALLVAALVAMSRGVEHAGDAALCLLAVVGVGIATFAARRRLLHRPPPADDEVSARVHRLVTAASADRLSEALVANGSLLALYAVFVLLEDARPGAVGAGVAAGLALIALSGLASSARHGVKISP